MTLMDHAEDVGGLGNVTYIPNDAIESMKSPNVYVVGNALLLVSNEIGEDGCRTVLKMVSLETGELLGESAFVSSGFVTVQVQTEKVGICDSEKGIVRICNKELQIVESYSLEKSSDNWYLSTDLRTLYQIDWEKGVYARELKTGITGTILTNAVDIYVCTQTENYLVLTYTDLESQKNKSIVLNLETGVLEKMPVDVDVISAVGHENVWLLGDSGDWGTYYIIANGDRKVANWKENRFDMLIPRNHLLSVDETARFLTIYDIDGTFVSRCELPVGEMNYAGMEVIWSDLWNGYFFLDYQNSRSGKLMFWNIEKEVEGEDFVLLPDKVVQGGISASKELYDRAEKISKEYDVNILIADQCQFEYDAFTSFEVTDEAYISQALTALENALSKYPKGFFEQLKYGNIQEIRIELIGGLRSKDKTVYSGYYVGFAQENSSYYLIVMDVFVMWESTVYHEFTHVMDARLEWDARLRPEALFSEERWLKLQPEGFSYAETYAQMPEETLKFVNSGYFVREYSCRSPREDRATMFESAILGAEYYFDVNPYLVDKLAYYNECIRDCFDTEGWPEVTVWEEMVKEKQ